MSWKDKTFKEKKAFYKERQVFFDAVKLAKEGEESVIKYKGEIYNLLVTVDVAIYPGRHSVLWEQSIGSGCVSVFRYLNKTQHVNVNNNFEIPVNTTNNYEHTIINNNTIIINLDNDILKEIANNLTNEIRENLNISS
jgi:hypothetical protein